ncbi:hypothetical protein pb186bvf_005066 [Paramecium bursaria]
MLQNYLFQLKGKKNSPQDIQLDFKPIFVSQLGLQMDTIPIFNNDNNPCLPGYITRAEQCSIADSVEQYQKQFNDKVMELSSKSKQLREPKIKSTNHYCNVCQVKFYEYLDHINSQSHKQRFRGNKFISMIQKECTPQSALRSPNVVALLDDGHETEPHLVKKRMTNDKQGNSFNLVNSCSQSFQLDQSVYRL